MIPTVEKAQGVGASRGANGVAVGVNSVPAGATRAVVGAVVADNMVHGGNGAPVSESFPVEAAMGNKARGLTPGSAEAVSAGAALRVYRESRGAGLRELAGMVGISAGYLSHVEHGKSYAPSLNRLLQMDFLLGLEPYTLARVFRKLPEGPCVRCAGKDVVEAGLADKGQEGVGSAGLAVAEESAADVDRDIYGVGYQDGVEVGCRDAASSILALLTAPSGSVVSRAVLKCRELLGRD